MDNVLNPIHCVSNNLHQTARAVSKIYSDEMRPSGITRSQFAILGILYHADTMALNTLAGALHMDRTTLSRNLTPLANKGLVTVKPSPADGRVREIRLTRTGKAKFRAALKLWRRAQQRVIDAFGEQNWAQLEATLTTLREIDA